MEVVEVDYLSNLPDELKLLIFSYLDTFDIIGLEEVSDGLQHLSYDKALISSIRLYKEYRCSLSHLRQIVLHKLRHDVITSLNINCVYWISRIELKKCLKLPRLKRLYVIDTKLAVDDLVDLDLPHLHALAITLSGTNFLQHTKLNILDNLKCLYVHYDVERQHCDIVSAFIRRCRNLEELWFIDLSPAASFNFRYVNMIGTISSTLKTVVISFHSSFTLSMLENVGFDVHNFNAIKTKTHLSLYRRTDGDDVVNIYDESYYRADNWKNYIERLKCDFPFGLNDARKLAFKKTTLEDIVWEELNLSHPASMCSTFCRCVLDSIVLAPNSKQLKKLSINTCSGQPKGIDVQKPEITEPLFKKTRKAHCVGSKTNSTLQGIIANSPMLEELEIWECEMVFKGLPKLTNNTLGSIQNLQRLRKLTLGGVPNYVSSSFLLDICQNCDHLTSLRISSPQQNASLNNFLCMSIPHAKSLKDLRFEHGTIPVGRILESFCSLSSPKLERLMLKCNDMSSSFDVESFQKFVTHNPQLRFLCLCIMKVSRSILKVVSREVKRLRSSDQIFVVIDCLNHTTIPYIHKVEMIECNSAVSTLDVFNGFVKRQVET